jgi:hypothetical protein
VVYNAEYDSNALSFTMFDLTVSETYQFRVLAINFNGYSDPSSAIPVYACGLPSGLERPTFVESD